MRLVKWKRHPVYPDYEFSNTGKIRGPAGEIEPRRVGKNGFLGITVNKQTIYVHRTVAELFVPNPDDAGFVAFRDGDQSNCDALNLEWRGKRKRQENAKLPIEAVEYIKANYRKSHRLFGSGGLSKKFGVTPQAILHIVGE